MALGSGAGGGGLNRVIRHQTRLGLPTGTGAGTGGATPATRSPTSGTIPTAPSNGYYAPSAAHGASVSASSPHPRVIAAASHAGAVLDRVLHGLSPKVRELAPHTVAVAHHANVPASLLTSLALHVPGGSDKVFTLARSLRNELKGAAGPRAASAGLSPDVLRTAHKLSSLDHVPNPHAAHPAKTTPAKPKTPTVLPGLSRSQSKVAGTILGVGERRGATRKEELSAVETGLVESGLRNLMGGDADSAGWRQERQSIYGSASSPRGPTNVRASARRYFSETAAAGRGKGVSAGTLAQSVQRSAFPEKYDEVRAQAAPILRAFGADPMRVAPQIVSRFHAIAQAAKTLDAVNQRGKLPYSLGAGHVVGKIPGPHKTLYDCSSAVSYVLQHAGFLKQGAQVSGDFENFGKPGPGAVTIYANGEHVFMKIGNRYFGTSHSNPGGGAGFIPKSYEQGEALSGNYVVRHVPGLDKKVAAALGIPTGTSAPGLSYGPGGTTATVTSGTFQDAAGVTTKPPVPRGTTSAGGGALSPMLAALIPQKAAPGGLQAQTDQAAPSTVARPKRRLASR